MQVRGERKDCFQEGSPEVERLDPGVQGSWWRQSQACSCLCKCARDPRQDVRLPGCGTLGRFLIIKMGGRRTSTKGSDDMGSVRSWGWRL